VNYAGIGSRTITYEESKLIEKIANGLSDRNYLLFSGNANGSDITFQRGSKNNCVIMLPWEGFNKKSYDPSNSIDQIIFNPETDIDAVESVNKYHPAPFALSSVGRKFMARNYFQIMGYGNYKPVSFVICCADQDSSGNVKGGTGQACRIATEFKIPVINIRIKCWKSKLRKLLNKYENDIQN